jgi:hypothetical protein
MANCEGKNILRTSANLGNNLNSDQRINIQPAALSLVKARDPDHANQDSDLRS